MEITDFYRAFLSQELSGPAGMNAGQVKSILGKFDKLTNTASPDTSFRVMHSAFAATDTDKALNTVRGIIQAGLEKLNKENKGVDSNPRSRLKALLERLRGNVLKCSVNGVDISKEELEKAIPTIPSFLKTPLAYEATATTKGKSGKPVKLTLEIRI